MTEKFNLSERKWLIAMLKAHLNYIGQSNYKDVETCWKIIDKLAGEKLNEKRN